jgi:hypothetical protein
MTTTETVEANALPSIASRLNVTGLRAFVLLTFTGILLCPKILTPPSELSDSRNHLPVGLHRTSQVQKR